MESEKTTPAIRLNKFIANSGLCTRREADVLIKKGEITVNGKQQKEMGVRVRVGIDQVEHLGKSLSGVAMRYILVNKPAFYVIEGKGGKSIFALISEACEERIYPVGALSLKDVGLQLFTNDRALSLRLKEKGAKEGSLYHITFDRKINAKEISELSKGVNVGKGVFKAREVVLTEEGEGKSIGLIPDKDEPKRIKEALRKMGLQLEKFDRVVYAGLTKKNLPRGRWRALTEREVSFLNMSVR